MLTDQIGGDFSQLHHRIQSMTRGRRFVITDKKGYHGLIPVVAKESDIFAFLSGAWPIFCLRPTEDEQEYRILGDACFSNHDVIFHEEGIPMYDFDTVNIIKKIRFKEGVITLI